MNMTDPDRRHLHDLEDQLARMTTRAEKAEAELAAHRAEAERPIGVGDVVQVMLADTHSPSPRIVVGNAGKNLMCSVDVSEGDHWLPGRSCVRVGRAVLMPDGSPVPEIGGGA